MLGRWREEVILILYRLLLMLYFNGCSLFRTYFLLFCFTLSACGESSNDGSVEGVVVADFSDSSGDDRDEVGPDVEIVREELTAIDTTQAPRIEAISNYLVLSGEEFQVVASATDPDGEVVAYKWKQLKGPIIELFNSKTHTLILRAPNVINDTLLIFELTVTDNTGKTATEQFTLAVTSPWDRGFLTGTVSFNRVMHDLITNVWDTNHVLQRPARGVLVELIAGDDVLDNTYTDIYGTYQFTAPSYEDHPKVNIRISSKLYSSSQWLVELKNNTEYDEEEKEYPLYKIKSADIDLEKATIPSDEDLASDAGFKAWLSLVVVDFNNDHTSREAAPYAVLDTVYTIMTSLHTEWDSSLVFPDLTVYWSIKNTAINGSFNEGEIGSTRYRWGDIILTGDASSDAEEYDEMVIAHEYGHYFQDVFSRDNSVGGIHTFSDHLNMSVAFSEGFATAFAGMVLKQSVYRDGSPQGGFHINLEENIIEPAGWFNERSVISLLYDFYDSDNGVNDTTSLGMRGILDAVHDGIPPQSAQTSIFSFMSALYRLNPEIEMDVENLLLRQEINPYDLDMWGSNEVNDAGVTSLLPIYKTIMVDGESVESCSIDNFITYKYNSNKLGARQYLRFTVNELSANNVHNILVQGDFGRDPEISIFQNGRVIGLARNPNGHSELLELTLASGEYVIEIGDFFNLTIPQGEACFELSISTQ